MRAASHHAGSRSSTVLLTLALLLIAALPRLYDLGDLGFYGDEETMSLPARALATGQGSIMPSGMPYYRALPQTWINALSARTFGLNEEFSYRLPAALLGLLTIPAFFFLTRPFFGVGTAFVASLLLALSDWHVVTSREARMYAPFLLCFVASVFFAWRWSQSARARDFGFAAAFFGLAASLHFLGLFAAPLAIIPLAFAGWTKTKPHLLVAFAVCAAVSAYVFDNVFVSGPRADWTALQGTHAAFVDYPAEVAPQAGNGLTNMLLAALLLGGGLGIWAAMKTRVADYEPGAWLRGVAHGILAIATALLASCGQLYGAALCALLLGLIHPWGWRDFWAHARGPILVVGIVAAINVAVAIAGAGAGDGLKSLAMFPFPYPAFFADMFPLLCGIFAVSAAYYALTTTNREDWPVRAALVAVIVPVAIIGVLREWGHVRYLIYVYPFALLVVASALRDASSWSMTILGRPDYWAVPLATLLVVAGVVGGHGVIPALRAATLTYGDSMNVHKLGFEIYPDHKSVGEYVRDRLDTGDIVIAEDMIQQRWYAGQVDYWLTDHIRQRGFIVVDEAGERKDVYVLAKAVTPEVLRRIQSIDDQRIWLITSAETEAKRALYLTEEQIAWVDELETLEEPAHVGADGLSRVYCINCKSSLARPGTAARQ